MKLPKNWLKNVPARGVFYLVLIPLCLAFIVLFIYGPAAVGDWLSNRGAAVLRHVRVEWFREGSRELGIIAAIVAAIVIYKIVLSGRK